MCAGRHYSMHSLRHSADVRCSHGPHYCTHDQEICSKQTACDVEGPFLAGTLFCHHAEGLCWGTCSLW